MSAPLLPRVRSILLVLTALAVLGGALVLARTLPGEAAPPPRRIEIVAASMTFQGNARLRVAPGERVEIVLVNRDPGMLHELSIPDLGLSTGPVEEGNSGSIVATFPDRPGEVRFLCVYHPVTMTGKFEVADEATARVR